MPTHNDLTTSRVLKEVAEERRQQTKKFGVQHHPDGTGDDPKWAVFARMDQQEWARIVTAGGNPPWWLILAEEFHEAGAETDPVKLRAELVQVAAVAVAWIEDIDQREAHCASCDGCERIEHELVCQMDGNPWPCELRQEAHGHEPVPGP